MTTSLRFMCLFWWASVRITTPLFFGWQFPLFMLLAFVKWERLSKSKCSERKQKQTKSKRCSTKKRRGGGGGREEIVRGRPVAQPVADHNSNQKHFSKRLLWRLSIDPFWLWTHNHPYAQWVLLYISSKTEIDPFGGGVLHQTATVFGFSSLHIYISLPCLSCIYFRLFISAMLKPNSKIHERERERERERETMFLKQHWLMIRHLPPERFFFFFVFFSCDKIKEGVLALSICL